MLEPQQLEPAGERLRQLGRPVKLSFDPGNDPDDKFSAALREVLDQLLSVAGGKLQVSTRVTPMFGDRPCLSIGNIHYLAVPQGPELEPFLGLLQTLSRTPPADADDQPPGLGPAQVQVLMAPTCPNCPLVVGACAQLAAGLPQVELSVIDVQYFTDLAGAVKSVPTVIVDGTYTVVGGLDSAELLEILRGRSEPDHMQRALGSMLENGRFVEAIPLLSDERALAALPMLMKEGTIKARMGVMLLAEEALESDPHQLDGALPYLLPLLESGDATLRGDTADLLGIIGAPGAREALTRLLQDENPDVREVAEEALESLRQPS